MTAPTTAPTTVLSTRLRRVLAVAAVLAWLSLAVIVLTGWTPARAGDTPPAQPGVVRQCYRDGTAARVYPMPGGHQMAISDGTCH